MKATLEFDLDNVDDRMAHLRCVKALGMALVLWEIQHNLDRHLYDKEDECYNNGVNDCLQKIFKLMDDRGININELVV
jgi:hypothetical protein